MTEYDIESEPLHDHIAVGLWRGDDDMYIGDGATPEPSHRALVTYRARGSGETWSLCGPLHGRFITPRYVPPHLLPALVHEHATRRTKDRWVRADIMWPNTRSAKP